jgi:uncharacterized repeat protein (TIGR01451 family)
MPALPRSELLRDARRQHKRLRYFRRLILEPLEDRRLLASLSPLSNLELALPPPSPASELVSRRIENATFFGDHFLNNEANPNGFGGLSTDDSLLLELNQVPLESRVAELPAFSSQSFDVHWNIQTEPAEGFTFDILVSVDGGPYQVWLEDTSQRQGRFQGQVGDEYRFISQVRDSLGSIESQPNAADAITTVLALPWQNPLNRFDVVGDGGPVTALHALRIINYLAVVGADYQLPEPTASHQPRRGGLFWDVNGNGKISALDALQVINELARLRIIGIDIETFANSQDADIPTGPMLPVGSTATFTYVVTNSGNADLTNVEVFDSVLGTITNIIDHGDGDTTLNIGESWTYEATAVVTAGQYISTGTVTANDPLGNLVTDSDDCHHFATDTSALAAVLEAEFPAAELSVSSADRAVLISGFAPNADMAGKIIRVAEDYFPLVIDGIKIDPQELANVLQAAFPSANLSFHPLVRKVVISGTVPRVEMIEQIARVAEDYYPNVIDNMTVVDVDPRICVSSE